MKTLFAGASAVAILFAAHLYGQEINLEGIQCPVTGNRAKTEFSLNYKGGKVFLNSGAEVEAMMSDTAGFFATKANQQLVATGQAIQVFCPSSGKLVDLERTNEIDGFKVAYCSSACRTEMDNAQAADQTKRVFGNKAFDRAFRVGIRCPVCGHAAKGNVTLAYKKGKVFFCCEAGPEAFMSDVQGYFAPKANHQLVATGQATQIGCPLTGRTVKSNLKLNVSGVVVGFCSQACATEVEQLKQDERINRLFQRDAFERGFAITLGPKLAEGGVPARP